MLIDKAIAPSYSTLRPTKPIASSTFPVYGDPTVTHTLAVTAGYAYSDPETVSMMLARMGLAENHCLRVAMSVDAMFILSTAHLVQSSDGSVVILAYRGTEPTNPVNWLTDADVHPTRSPSGLRTPTTCMPSMRGSTATCGRSDSRWSRR